MKDIEDSIRSEMEEETEDDSISEDNPEWDGSESGLVADDDAEEYEIPETGIKISFVMTKEEMYKCLYHSDLYKTKGTRAVISSVIFGIAAVVFAVACFTSGEATRSMNLFFSIFCLVMIVLVWLVPYLHIKSLAKVMANGKTVEAEVYPDHIDIGSGSGAWSIDLDGNCELLEFDNIFMICLKDGRNFAIPERVIEPEVYNEFKAILISGTNPGED